MTEGSVVKWGPLYESCCVCRLRTSTRSLVSESRGLDIHETRDGVVTVTLPVLQPRPHPQDEGETRRGTGNRSVDCKRFTEEPQPFLLYRSVSMESLGWGETRDPCILEVPSTDLLGEIRPVTLFEGDQRSSKDRWYLILSLLHTRDVSPSDSVGSSRVRMTLDRPDPNLSRDYRRLGSGLDRDGQWCS